MLTFQEVKEKLCTYDEITILEILEISSEDLVERFEDKIEEKYETFSEDLEEENPEER